MRRAQARRSRSPALSPPVVRTPVELIGSFLLLSLTQLGVDHAIGVAWRPWFRIRLRSEDIHYHFHNVFNHFFHELPNDAQAIVYLLRNLFTTLIS